MGLDMYAYTTTAVLTQLVDFDEPKSYEKLHYWRKHPNLHGWMEALYFRKGGKDSDFNLSPVALDSADLDRLEGDVKANKLPFTEGFFFGATDGTEADDDLAFIAKARAAIAKGETVFYLAWW